MGSVMQSIGLALKQTFVCVVDLGRFVPRAGITRIGFLLAVRIIVQ